MIPPATISIPRAAPTRIPRRLGLRPAPSSPWGAVGSSVPLDVIGVCTIPPLRDVDLGLADPLRATG
jgi:hypothetical protein